MAKRTATSNLNQDNWDREDESEEAGTFTRAPEDVLKGRVIKTAKRRVMGGTTAEGGAEKKSVFSGFTGFSTKPTTTDPSSAFSFLKSTAGPAATTTTVETNKNGTDGKDDEYYAKLKGLNQSVSNWIKKHVDENPFVDLKPIFADYEKYFGEIEEAKGKGCSTEAKKSEPTFSFGEAKKETPVPTFKFGGDTSTTPQFTFGSKVDPAPPTFSFGAKPGEATKTFSFGGATPAAAPAPLAPAPLAPATTEEENEDDEPPKVTFTQVVEEGAVHSVKCKVFAKKDGNYVERGVGMLYVKQVPDKDKYQLIVRADTNLGNLICNFILAKSMPTQRMGKKDVMTVCLPLPDSKPPPVPVLFRLKSPEEADSLLKALDEHKR